jgi:hypothetical protein
MNQEEKHYWLIQISTAMELLRMQGRELISIIKARKVEMQFEFQEFGKILMTQSDIQLQLDDWDRQYNLLQMRGLLLEFMWKSFRT